MKATIEFNDALYRQLKIAAAMQNRKIREMVEEGVRLVLKQTQGEGNETSLQSIPMPIVRKSQPKHATIPKLSNQQLESLLVAEDKKHYGST